MNDRIISYETAKLAKELGFYDLNVFGKIRISQEHFYYEGKLYHISNLLEPNAKFKEELAYNAPTQTSLQKWLRERYNVGVYVHPYFDHCKCQYDSHRQLGYGGTTITAWEKEPDCKFVTISEFLIFPQDILDDGETIEKDFHRPIFKTYEDALEYELYGAMLHIKRKQEK